MFGNPETTTGGNALKFYASVRIDIRRIGQLKEGEEIQGNRTRVKVVKNKLAPPFRKAEFDILYGEGISKTGELIDMGVDLDILKKSGSWFSYGETRLGQGRDAVKNLLRDNPELVRGDRRKDKSSHYRVPKSSPYWLCGIFLNLGETPNSCRHELSCFILYLLQHFCLSTSLRSSFLNPSGFIANVRCQPFLSRPVTWSTWPASC